MALSVACPWLSKADNNRQATDIAMVADADIDGGSMLVVTGTSESGYRKEIERCECKPHECDRGNAVSVYQLQKYWWAGHTAQEICKDNRLATFLAYKALVSMRDRADARSALRLYVGRLSDDDPRVNPRITLYNQLMFAAWYEYFWLT